MSGVRATISPSVTSVIAAIPGLQALWAQTLGDPRITIAVLDGPVDRSHPSLVDADLTDVETLIPGTPDAGPASQHGTHVASILFAQHPGPLRGLVPKCRGLIVPIYGDGPDGSLAPCSHIDLARALLLAAQHGASVINISGGQLEPTGTAHPILADAVRHCADKGILIVAAAGNQGCDCLNVPAALPYVLAVGAMDARGEPLEFSNWGQTYQSQGILALGDSIPGAVPGGAITAQTGTSYATAIVSGVAGLLLSLQLRRGQSANARQVRKIILDSAQGCEYQTTVDCRRVLAGRLNIPGATAHIAKGAHSMGEPIDDVVEAPPPPASETPNVDPASMPADPTGVLPATGPSEPQPTVAPPLAPVTPPGEPSRPLEPVAPATADSGQISPAACGCDGQGAGAAQLVYALGQLGTDFGTEARRDSFVQAMDPQANNPHDPHQLLAHLDKKKDDKEVNASDAAAIIWTLNLDATPIYAIAPAGPFAREGYDRLRQFLDEQLHKGVERISIPGHIAGSIRLFTGQVVPVVHPEVRGMFSWTTDALVKAACGEPPPATQTTDYDDYTAKMQGVRNFLERIYHELRNLGVTPQERAINFAATNAFNVHQIFQDALDNDMQLDTIEVERSPICRPDSDCWDVKLTFFNPSKVFEQARKVHRFSVDVSDVVPVTVAPVRSWSVR